jgi:eukaryotic-like serine/threonine-protein kinase
MSDRKEPAPDPARPDLVRDHERDMRVTPPADATVDPSTPSLAPASGTSTVSKSIGSYRLLKKLGEGGMGLVWLAEQTAPVRRLVALKLIRAGFYDDSLLQRFQSEQQSLAVMNHPTIAKVFDAGTTPDGQPYFVMEYVDGSSITKYCDTKKLKIRHRLELFLQVCEGVQHAHQKAIMHRDLKPSNVLVAEIDGKPVPRIIDFGIAKAITSQTTPDRTLFTQAGALVGTPGFMSPEQAAGLEDVDTRTDVYSLGVILYVLLTGTLPFDTEQWNKRPIDEILRHLREDDPPTPSIKLDLEQTTTQTTAEQRSTVPQDLLRILRGDLDWITMKAIEKDRARRYGTPTELASDIRRYLDNEPVLARPASSGYRLRKYVRRHRIGVAISAATAVLLVAFATAQAVELRRITRERDRANRITDFMTTMFKVSDPSEARGNTITAREVLDKASTQIETGLSNDPQLQSQLMYVMGTVYESLGLYSRAQTLFLKTVDLRRKVLGPKAPDTLQAQTYYAWELVRGGKASQAEGLLRDTVDLQRRILGPDDRDTATSLFYLGWTLHSEGRDAEAEKFLRQAADIRRRVAGPDDADALRAMSLLAAVMSSQGHYSDAEKLLREVLDARRRVLGADHPQTLATMGNVSVNLMYQGHFAAAEKLERQVLDARRRVLGPEHPQTLASTGNLALDLRNQGKYAEAEKLERQTLEIRRRVEGPEQADTLASMENLAGILLLEGRYLEADKLYKETLEIQRRVLGPDNPATLGSIFSLALNAFEMGHYPESEKLFRESLEQRRRVLGPEHPDTLASMTGVAGALMELKRYSEAEALSREAFETQRRVFGPENPDTLDSMRVLASALDRLGRLDEGENLARDSLAISRRVLGPDNPRTAISEHVLAAFVAQRHKTDEAVALLSAAIDHQLEMDSMKSIATDPDFKSLRGDPRFTALVARAKAKVAAAQKPQ